MAQALKILLDSVILIDHLNGIQQASRFIAREANRSAISVITRAEVLAGARPRALAKVERLLDLFPNLDISADVADLAAALRRKHRWKLPDAFQAALAKRHKLRLATRDVRDFRPDLHRFVLIPYKLG
jgi:hypothetical protein